MRNSSREMSGSELTAAGSPTAQNRRRQKPRQQPQGSWNDAPMLAPHRKARCCHHPRPSSRPSLMPLQPVPLAGILPRPAVGKVTKRKGNGEQFPSGILRWPKGMLDKSVQDRSKSTRAAVPGHRRTWIACRGTWCYNRDDACELAAFRRGASIAESTRCLTFNKPRRLLYSRKKSVLPTTTFAAVRARDARRSAVRPTRRGGFLAGRPALRLVS